MGRPSPSTPSKRPTCENGCPPGSTSSRALTSSGILPSTTMPSSPSSPAAAATSPASSRMTWQMWRCWRSRSTSTGSIVAAAGSTPSAMWWGCATPTTSSTPAGSRGRPTPGCWRGSICGLCRCTATRSSSCRTPCSRCPAPSHALCTASRSASWRWGTPPMGARGRAPTSSGRRSGGRATRSCSRCCTTTRPAGPARQSSWTCTAAGRTLRPSRRSPTSWVWAACSTAAETTSIPSCTATAASSTPPPQTWWLPPRRRRWPWASGSWLRTTRRTSSSNPSPTAWSTVRPTSSLPVWHGPWWSRRPPSRPGSATASLGRPPLNGSSTRRKSRPASGRPPSSPTRWAASPTASSARCSRPSRTGSPSAAGSPWASARPCRRTASHSFWHSRKPSSSSRRRRRPSRRRGPWWSMLLPRGRPGQGQEAA
mmetsp:Transcript_39599/g.112295  ORF Transcript_39599/g.112295 Transcript_39599/m.112295 type:complete len:426 (+) Transcript_39599:1123-2400(+)